MTTEVATGCEWMEIEDLSLQWFYNGYFCGRFQKRDRISLLGEWGLVVKSIGVSMW
jgi:hypothetical protein